MTTLLTGATGYLGGVVLERWLAYGATPIRCLVRTGSARSRLLALRARFGPRSLEVVEGNLARRGDAERAVAGVERVVHLAASMRGAPADMFRDSVVGTSRLLEALTVSTVRRFVFVSSLGVYGLADISTERPVAEDTRLDPHPERRDVYSHTKIWQERLVRDLLARSALPTIVLRPGPLYGRGGPALPGRLGIQVAGLMLHLGRDVPIPLSYVDNCAHALWLAAFDETFAPGAYNVLDDELPTAGEYLRRYGDEVRRIRTLRLPFATTLLLSRWLERYHHLSRGQIPLALTPYRTRGSWRGHVYDNTRLKRAGWSQAVATPDALTAAFRELRAQVDTGGAP